MTFIEWKKKYIKERKLYLVEHKLEDEDTGKIHLTDHSPVSYSVSSLAYDAKLYIEK